MDGSKEAWPRTVDQAVDRLLANMSVDLKETFRGTTRAGAQRRSLSVGMWIRNAFGMWRGNHELLVDCARVRDGVPPSPTSNPGPMGADEASVLILGLVWDRLHSVATNQQTLEEST